MKKNGMKERAAPALKIAPKVPLFPNVPLIMNEDFQDGDIVTQAELSGVCDAEWKFN
ncbi:MAG: hypothetical protein ACLQOO_23225 [Terriglobia bacterium]